jgi:hypothetical protein
MLHNPEALPVFSVKLIRFPCIVTNKLGVANANRLHASGSVVLIFPIFLSSLPKIVFSASADGVRGFVNSAAVRLVVQAGSAGLVRVHAHSPFPALPGSLDHGRQDVRGW